MKHPGYLLFLSIERDAQHGVDASQCALSNGTTLVFIRLFILEKLWIAMELERSEGKYVEFKVALTYFGFSAGNSGTAG